MKEWFENEEFWIEMYPYLFTEERLEDAEEQVEKIIELAGVKGGNVLDLCCGPGRHSVVLARRGFFVTGVDRSPFLLEKAKVRAKAEGVSVDWVQQDMREFSRPGHFNLVINMFTSFGYFDDRKDDLLVLRNIYESLVPQGVCVIDVIGKERLAGMFMPTTSDKFDDGTLLIQRHEIYDDWSRIRNEWILLRGDRAQTFDFHHSVYSGQELKGLLSQTGFSEIRLFGNLDGDEYGRKARRLIAVARKAA